jgi:hypothetical protein
MQDTAELKPVVKKKAKRTKPGEARRPVAVVVKGNEKWKAWLEKAASHSRLSVSTFLDLAAKAFAKTQGFSEEPPER